MCTQLATLLLPVYCRDTYMCVCVYRISIKNGSTDLHETFWKDPIWAKEELIKFWGQSEFRYGSTDHFNV